MAFYFEDHLSMHARTGAGVEQTLDAIMQRYRGQHPPHPPSFRPYQRRGITRGRDYRYQADFNAEFPDAAEGSLIYAWARMWSDAESEIKFDVSCRSPMVLYRNQECVFRSTIVEERYPEKRVSLQIALRPGWNHFVIRFRKTRGGFGGVFGTWLGKLPYYFLMPTPRRAAQEGWLYCQPMRAELPAIPTEGVVEADTGVAWLPDQEWTEELRPLGQCRRIFGPIAEARAVAWTRAEFLRVGDSDYTLRGSCRSPIRVTIADQVVLEVARPGPFTTTVSAPFGRQDVMVEVESRDGDWGFELTLLDGDSEVALANPANVQGPPRPWMYLGPLPATHVMDGPRLRDLHQVAPGVDGDVYWRLDAPDMWVRPYNDNALYGRWNYPLGVTLYGLLHSARALGATAIQQYIVGHIKFCCEIFHYAMWDRQQYGGATNVHHLLTSIDSLDDCGSFGSCVLEVAKYFDVSGAREISDYVANYIEREQVRLPDGTFFRKDLMHSFHEDTLWADDLYMSVPFLCRYYQLTGDRRYIDDAARQFIGFRKLLYLPERKIMSHVYDFSRQLATGVAWGRGNGWVIFSLSELLAVLPEDHALRATLIDMFRELCSGYLALQDESGMWHQVLTEADSYPETSCTAMFTCAFARGAQAGWLVEPEPYVRAVFKAWTALNRISIDGQGNVHGVCRGSEFSFTSDYYKHDLLWNLNDTHGIGIVLLAGVEVLRLTKHLQNGVESRPSESPASPRRASPARTSGRARTAAR